MNIWVILKNLVTANMNIFLMFGKNLKWKRWTVIMIFICVVLLLADIFEIFRNDRTKSCGLCPSHYLCSPVLNWDGIFNMKKTELEFIPDPDMCIFFEKDRRVGVPYISRRYSKASNKYLESYDPKQESK